MNPTPEVSNDAAMSRLVDVVVAQRDQATRELAVALARGDALEAALLAATSKGDADAVPA